MPAVVKCGFKCRWNKGGYCSASKIEIRKAMVGMKLVCPDEEGAG